MLPREAPCPACRRGGARLLRLRLKSLPLLAGLALAGGAVTVLAFPPISVSPLAVVGVALGLWACARAGSAGRGALCGLAWGLGFAGLLLRWTLELAPAAYASLVPVQAVFWMLPGVVAARASRLGPGWWVVAVTSAWTVSETLRGRVPLGGFEWGQLGIATAPLPLRHAAAVVGTLGVTALWVAVAAGLAAIALPWPSYGHVPRRRSRTARPLGIAVVAVVAVTLAGARPWTVPDGVMQVAIVQINDPCPDAFAVDCPDLYDRLLRRFAAGTATLTRVPQLLLWGEGALRGDTLGEAGENLVAVTGGLPSLLLAGTTSSAGPGQYYNRNVLYAPDGTVLDAYAKRQPVPFGEYVPWREVLGGIADVGRLVPTDMVRGSEPGVLDVPLDDRTVDLGTVVSWEVTFSRLVRGASRDAQALATLTTQASYGNAPVSDQLIGAAQLRSAELQKAMVIAATTGRSAIIAPGGELLGITDLFSADTLVGPLPLRTGETPFARWGEAPVVVLALVGFVGALVAAFRQGRYARGRPAARRRERSRHLAV